MANDRELLMKTKVALIKAEGELFLSVDNVARWQRIVDACKGKSFITRFEGVYCHSGRGSDLNDAKKALLAHKARILALKMSIAGLELKVEIWVAEQKALQETFLADAMEQQVAQETAKAEQERIKIAQELQQINKAKQELQRIRVEKAKAEAAERLAKSGDLAAAEVLLRAGEKDLESKAKQRGGVNNIAIISGLSIVALGAGFGIFKLLK